MMNNREKLSLKAPLLAIFQKRFDGDDALLHLASLRFKEAGLGTEFYPGSPEELNWLLEFKPSPESPAVVHMNRHIDLFNDGNHREIIEFAKGFKDQIFGLVIHDQIEIVTRFDDYLAALRGIDSALRDIGAGPYLFIEYAVGLDPEQFVELFKSIRELGNISCCIDIGHVGLWEARKTYSRNHPETDLCLYTPYDPELPGVIDDVQNAVAFAIDKVMHVIHELGSIGKPIHFHLHDAHPISTCSPFGISDHLSFLDKIPIPFEYRGGSCLPMIFGPSGLSKILTESLGLLGPDRVSFTLEIHPKEGRLPLRDASYLFNHWENKTNAERMNYWLSILLRNHELVLEVLRENSKLY